MKTLLLVLCLLAAHLCGVAAAAEPARLPFFAFENGLKAPPAELAATLKELGYDGLSASGYEVAPLLKELHARGLKLYNTYLTPEFDAATNALTEPLRRLIDDLQGSSAALWIAPMKVTKDGKAFAKSSPDGDEVALARLREIADYAEPRGVKIALYPHTWFWLERVEDGVRLADKLNRAGVGATFNLCHWLKVEGDRDPLPMLRAALPRLFFVSINGADTGDTQKQDWDQLIQTLDRGSYDVAGFLRQLQGIGYAGPVGLQCYNLKGDPKDNLARSMAAWREFGAAEPLSRKLIATGWDSPTPARFRAELAAFEKWGVFGGTTLAPARRGPDGAQHDCRNAFSREHWERSDFTEALADLKAARPVTATDNFLFLYANPGDVDWFDDAGWREIVEHWGHLAWLAKQGGLRGLLYDAEPYTPPHSQFFYAAQTQRDRHTFDAYRAKARQRGCEVMKAVVAEFPDITLFTYRLLCDLLPLTASANPALALEAHPYGLQPAFLDGFFDAAPPTVTLVEGDENAYSYSRPDEFDRAFTQLKLNALRLIAPEHRSQFRAQVQVSHGIYLDAHVNPTNSPWYMPPLRGSRVARLEANVSAALQAADEYVWIYGETARWWPGGQKEHPAWPEKLAGADRALQRAVNPVAAAHATLASVKPEDNLLANPAFAEADTNGLPLKWWTWQDERSHGQFTTRDGAACLKQMANGCFGQTIPVQPGERYAVSARVRRTGAGVPMVSVRWKTPEQRWTAESLDQRLSIAHRDGWNELVALVEVPAGVGHLVVLLGAAQQTAATDLAEFDDVRLVRIRE